MNQSKALNLGGESESGALDARVPESGAAADCYAVACTATMLHSREWDASEDKRGESTTVSPRDCARHAVTLHRLSGQLHRLAERECNGYPDEKREARLQAQARAIAEHYGLRCYFQGDPRGCALYLIPPEIVPGEDAAGRTALTRYVYPSDKTHPASFADLQARWIEANYTNGHAVVRLGR